MRQALAEWKSGFYVVLLAATLAACSSSSSSPPPSTTGGTTSQGTIQGEVAGTTVIAFDDSGQILASDDTTGKAPNAQGHFPFTLTGIPTGVNVRVFLLTEGGIFPMSFGPPPGSNVFSLNAAGTVILGFVATSGGQAIPQFTPSNVTLRGANHAIPPGLLTPNTAGLSFGELLAKGFTALKDGLPPRARAYFGAAVGQLNGSQSPNDADTARFFFALSSVASLGFDVLSDGNPGDLNRLADLLDTIGCNPSDAARNNVQTLQGSCPPHPTSVPTGAQLQAFLYSNVVRPALLTAVSNLNLVSQSFNKTWVSPLDHNQVKSDYGDVLVFRAAFKAALQAIAAQQAYVPTEITQPILNPNLTDQQFLSDNPTFLTLKPGGGTFLVEAKGYFTTSYGDDILQAIVFLQNNRPGNQADYLITLDRLHLTPQDLAGIQGLIQQAKVSVNGPADFGNGVTLDLSKFFGPPGQNIRALLPPFTGDIPGFFPDPTLGGIIVSGIDLNRDNNHNNVPDVLE